MTAMRRPRGRHPSEDEWYKAAYYKGGGDHAGYWDYPTSSDTVPSNDLVDPTRATTPTTGNGSIRSAAPYYRREVGEFADSRQPLRHVRPGRQRLGVERGGIIPITWSVSSGAGRSALALAELHASVPG